MIKIKDGMTMGQLTIAVQQQEIDRLKSALKYIATSIDPRTIKEDGSANPFDLKTVSTYAFEILEGQK